MLKSFCEMVYPDGPVITLPANEKYSAKRSWWRASDDGGLDLCTYRGLPETIQFIFENYGDCDGVIGFSQGGALSVIIAALKADPSRAKDLGLDPDLIEAAKFRFFVSYSAFRPRDERIHKWWNTEDPIAFPGLFVYGTADQIISPERTIALAKCFQKPDIIEHSGKHFVAAYSQLRPQYTTFFQQMFPDD